MRKHTFAYAVAHTHPPCPLLCHQYQVLRATSCPNKIPEQRLTSAAGLACRLRMRCLTSTAPAPPGGPPTTGLPSLCDTLSALSPPPVPPASPAAPCSPAPPSNTVISDPLSHRISRETRCCRRPRARMKPMHGAVFTPSTDSAASPKPRAAPAAASSTSTNDVMPSASAAPSAHAALARLGGPWCVLPSTWLGCWFEGGYEDSDGGGAPPACEGPSCGCLMLASIVCSGDRTCMRCSDVDRQADSARAGRTPALTP